MRALAAALIIFVTVSCFCIYIEIYTSDAVKKMNGELERIKAFVTSEETEKASDAFFALKRNWEKHEKILQLLTEHIELDTVNEQIAVLTAVFENNEYEHFREAAYTLSFFLNHIKEKKEINLTTIL